MNDRITFEARADAGTYALCVLDFTNITDADAALALIAEAERRIRTMSVAALRVLVDVGGSDVSLPAITALDHLARVDAPHVQRTAIIGLSIAHRIVLRQLRRTTGRELRDFTRRADALIYLER